MQEQARLGLVRVPIEVVDALGVKGRRPPDQTVNDIPLLEQQLGQI